jgi:uncharacterized PurR-regulated membrane protein YhhQ (DUF165 family)
LYYGTQELSDFAVYSKIRQRSRELGILVSGIVGSVIDSALFLYLAFGSLAHIEGQIFGKIAMSALAATALYAYKRRGEHD